MANPSVGDYVLVAWRDARDIKGLSTPEVKALKGYLWRSCGKVADVTDTEIKIVQNEGEDDQNEGVLIVRGWIEGIEVLKKGT